MNAAYETNEKQRGFAQALIRPAWTPATIALMIIGFMIFWPLGLAMLAYILWGDRLDEFKSNVNAATNKVSDNIQGAFKHNRQNGSSGNAAFDEWREAEIARIEEERSKLEETRREFDAHLRELRRAKDQEEFDAFMGGNKKPTKSKKNKTVPRVK